MNDIASINKEYYDLLYKPGNAIIRWLHGRLSFDQQSKLRPNLAVAKPILKRILRAKGNAKVLDYGCGWGLFLLSVSQDRIYTYCYDISESAMIGLENVMQLFGQAVKRISLDENGVISTQDFDLIICSHVLEHVEDDRRLLANLTRALRPGGFLLINVPINEDRVDPKHVRSYTAEILKGLMMHVGLKIEVERQAGKLGEWVGQPEDLNNYAKIGPILIRMCRAFFSLLPYNVILWGEKLLLANLHYRQLIVVGRK
jgi:2-polyprenyl-3-methyl-5-hydroxy-6-metoxy-1,4-benzoquinol methylase